MKLVPLFLEFFLGSGTQITAKSVMAFRICRKSTCFVEKKRKKTASTPNARGYSATPRGKKRRRDRTQEATQLRLVPKKRRRDRTQEATQLRLVPKNGVKTERKEATQLRLVPKNNNNFKKWRRNRT